MSLDLKYRPTIMADMVGNDVTLQGLRAHFSQEDKSRISHCHLISGPSGVGKTSVVRIIASEFLGAHARFGVKEFNTGNTRGINTVRDIIEDLNSLPMMGGSVVYFIDEAQSLTADAKRAFLKPTEEPPAHAFFFFGTTDKDTFLKGDEGKAIGTRCTKWALESLTPRQIATVVRRTAKSEDFALDDSVLDSIISSSEGSARNAIVLLGQAMCYKDDVQAQLQATTYLTEGSSPDTLQVCRTLCSASWKEISAALSAVKGKVEPETVRRSVLGYCSSILMKSTNNKTMNARVCRVMEEFAINTYDSGFPGLVLAAWRSLA